MPLTAGLDRFELLDSEESNPMSAMLARYDAAFRWTESAVNDRFAEIMTRAFADVVGEARKKKRYNAHRRILSWYRSRRNRPPAPWAVRLIRNP